MDNKIFKELKFVPEKGGFFYNEVRYLLIRPETLAAFQKAIEEEIGEKGFSNSFREWIPGRKPLFKKISRSLWFLR